MWTKCTSQHEHCFFSYNGIKRKVQKFQRSQTNVCLKKRRKLPVSQLKLSETTLHYVLDNNQHDITDEQ